MKNLIFNPENKPVILWGAGKRTERILNNGLVNFSVRFIVDTDKNKKGKKLNELEIILPGDIHEWKAYYIIVIPEVYQDDVFQELSEKKLQYGRDYIGYGELCEIQAAVYKDKLLNGIKRGMQIIVIPEWPIGDMCSVLGFVKAYKERVRKPLVFYIIGKRGKEVLELCPYIQHVEMIPIDCIRHLEDLVLSEKRNIFDMRLLFESSDKLDALRAVRRFFQLPEETRFDRFTLKGRPDKEEIEKLFASFKLRRGKTVFIVPYANWFGEIGKRLKSTEFWAALCTDLSKEGFDVVFNSEEEVVPGTAHVFLELSKLPAFIELCGNVIGIRTGLLNFIAVFTNVTIQCFWPEDNSPYFETDTWKYFSNWGNIPESTRSDGLMEAGLSLTKETERTEKIFEFICQNDREDIKSLIRNLDRDYMPGGFGFDTE